MKFFFFFVPVLLMACSNPKTEIINDFNSLFKSQFNANEPGGVILVKKNNKTVFLKGFGLEDMETNINNSPTSVFNTGSVSKTFVAYAILMLEQEGILSIEDSLYKYFDDFKSPDIAKKVKVKHLLTHTSGLPDSRPVSDNYEFYLSAKDAENFEPIKATTQLNFEPGEQFEYSNPAFNGLALIIEKITDDKWQNYVIENIFKPSKMDDSKITDGPHPTENVTHAYIKDNNEFKELDYGEEPTFAAAGNGGVWSSVIDLAKYENALLKHTFVNKEVLDKSRSIYKFDNWKSDTPPDVGLSWFITNSDFPDNIFNVDIVSHTGWQGGFRAFYISIPEKDILYTAVFNTPIPNLSESYNPFNNISENEHDVRVAGLKILQNYNWLD